MSGRGDGPDERPPAGDEREQVRATRTDGLDAPEKDPDARLYSGGELEAEDGSTRTPRQMNVGVGNDLGGGEWPDPDTPPVAPAPGAVDGVPERDRGGHGPRTEPHGP